jgi:ABC-type dipeptide/oligopeptide/nickel transport system ATPase subunit
MPTLPSLARVEIRSKAFEMARGEVLAILSGGGGGKSTLLRLLTGPDLPKGGTIIIDGMGTPGFEVGNWFLNTMHEVSQDRGDDRSPGTDVVAQQGLIVDSNIIGSHAALRTQGKY